MMEGGGVTGRLGAEGGPEGGVGGFCADAVGARNATANANSTRMRLSFMGGILEADRLTYCMVGGPFVWVKVFEGTFEGTFEGGAPGGSVSHIVRTTRNWALPLVMRA